MIATIPENARLITAEEAATLIVSCGRFVENGYVRRAEMIGTVNPPVIAGTDLRLFALLKSPEGKTIYVCLTKDEADEYSRISMSQEKLDSLRKTIAERRIVLKGCHHEAHRHRGAQDTHGSRPNAHFSCKADDSKPACTLADSDNVGGVDDNLTTSDNVNDNEFGHSPSVAHPSI